MKSSNIKFATNYSRHPWTWIKRFLVFVFLIFLVMYLRLAYGGAIVWQVIFVLGSAVFLLVKPKDDVALDNVNLYCLKKSILPFLTRVKKFPLAEIKSITLGGVYSERFEIMELLGYGFSNTMEIVFTDNTSRAIDLRIYRKDLKRLVNKINETINKNGN